MRTRIGDVLRVCFALAAVQVSLSAAFPRPQGHVSDFANIMAAGPRTQLESLLRETELDTSAQIALVTVPSLDGMTIEEYSNRLFKEWGIGQKGKDNGVLVLVAPNERKVRVEVGYGLEPVLPDGLAGEIIRTEFLPAFKNGDYNAGITRGVQHIARIVEANQPLTAAERRELATRNSDGAPAWLTIPFLGIFIAIGFFALGIGLRSKTFFPVIWGGLFGGIPFIMSLVPALNASTWILGPLALGMLALGLRKGNSPMFVGALRPSGKSGGGVMGWTMGTSSKGGGGSSGSSGGGFGGGSSGGGGASGSW